MSSSSFVLVEPFHFPPRPKPAAKRRRSPPVAHPRRGADRFKGIADKTSWREAADVAVECLLDRLDTLAADLVMRPAMKEFGLTFDQWVKLLGMMCHALFPEVYTRPGEKASHEGLVPPKGGSGAFPLTPRRLAILVDLMRSWDAGGEGLEAGEV